ncbi:MAG TPA: peptidyl-prolyl cis-trans isomerase [Vicinamibacterales bacterium]|jgi:peptidyl-prolyl cis-trans isomerase D|nr:peptidyl-prolyl cis-trans isomerase [Vicinamibacterales bacterium]
MTMLDRMRRHRNWLKWSLALVVLTFIIFYIPDFLQRDTGTAGATARETVATVDGHDLLAGEFQQRYVAQMQAYQQQFGGSMNAQLLRQLGIDQQVLSQMVDEQVAVLEAERQGVKVSDDELAQRIFAIPGLQENGRFIGEARYEALLRQQRPPLTKSQFEDRFRRSIMVERLRTALTDWMAISDKELEAEYRKRNEKVKLQVVAFTADRFRDKVSLSDADIATYFDAHKAEYRVGEQRSVKFLLLDRDQARLKVVVPPTDIQRYYNDNIQQYQTPEQIRASHILLKTEGKDEAAVKKRAEALLARVKGGADFAELAKNESEDEGSKKSGGDLGFFGKGRMVPEFETAAFAMQPGQTSDLVRSQFGFHIIRVVEKKAGETRPLDQVRQQIQDQLAQQQADAQITERARQLEARIKNPGDLAEAAGEQGLMVQESGYFQRGDPVPGLGAAPQVAATAFSLADNAVSAPISAQRGVAFITVAGKKDPYVPKLDEVKEKVRVDAIRAKAAELSKQRATELAGGLKSAPNFAAAAKAQGLESKDTDLITRGSAIPDVGTNPEVDKAAFSLPVGGVSGPIATSEGTVIIRVVQRDEVTPAQVKSGSETFRAELLNERRSNFFNAYMNKAKERMKVEINPEVVSRVTSSLRL